MQSSMEEIDGGDIKEIKNISGRRSIRDSFTFEHEAASKSHKKVYKDLRSISEPPKTNFNALYMNNNGSRLKTIRDESDEDNDEYENFSKSTSQLNDESDLDLDLESASQTPTPTLLTAKSRRINSENNLNDSKRLTGFLGNRSKRFCASTSELNFASHLDTHKSLFSPKNNQNSRSGSLYGSNMSLNSTNSRLFMVNSPFYNGKTMFGGASSYPKRDINQAKVLRTPIQMRPSSSLSNSSNTSTKSESAAGLVPESNAAKRILEIMTQFSGPLKETRSMGSNINSMIKIPGLVQSRKRFGDDDLQLDRSISLTRPTAPYSRPIITAKNQQPESPSILLNSTSSTKTPQVPTMSQLLKMKRLQNNTERAREIANRSESFLNQIHEYKLPSQTDERQSSNNSQIVNSSTTSFKMKSNITKNLLRNEKPIDELPPQPLNLPNIQLPELKSIPKFDIKLPESTVAINKTKVPTTPVVATKPIDNVFTQLGKSNAEKEVQQKDQISDSKFAFANKFTFAKPIRFDASTIDVRDLKVTTDSFKFSKPIRIDDSDVNEKSKNLDVQPTKPATDNLFKNLAAKQKELWECESCMTRNDVDRTKCLCCNTLKLDSGIHSSSSVTSVATKESLVPASQPDDLFKKLAAQQKKSQWECSDCMTKNDLDKDKCLCCESPKPGSKPTAASAAPITSFKFGMPATTTTTTSKSTGSDDLFKNLAAQQKKSQWECSECMSSNDVSKTKCACCEAPKPGSEKPSTGASSSFSFGIKPVTNDTAPKFSFGMPAASKTTENQVDSDFKKIVEKQSANWECSACMTRNDQSRSKCICCEQAKPGSSDSKSQFSFGSKITSTVSLPAPSEVKFSFGVQPVQQSKSDIVISTKNDDAKKEAEPVAQTKLVTSIVDEVDKPKPTFSFGSNIGTTPAPSFTFKAPATNSSTSVSVGFTLSKADESTTKKEPESEKTISSTPFSFGAPPAAATTTEIVPEKKTVAFGIEPKPVETKEIEEKKPVGGFSFPTATTPASSDALKTNGGFSFGGFAKTPETPKTEVKPAVGGFSFSSTTNSLFGSKPAASSAPAESAAQKPAIFGSFGNTTTPQFGAISNTIASSAPSVPVFGSSSFTFGTANAIKKDENTPVFPSSNSSNSTSNMIFGSGLNSAATPTFGSTATTNNNNESGFGSKMVGFGGIQSAPSSQSQKRTLDFASADVPQKKFDFGSQQSSQQSNTTPFQFNAQPEAQKPSFNFSATPTPASFNFTGISSNNNTNPASGNVQENLFQFGANNPSSQGIFGVNTQPATPMMQFGATSTPTVAIQGINAFASQPASNASQQRKILRAARRTTTRR